MYSKNPNFSPKITPPSRGVGIRNISDYSAFGVLLKERTVESADFRLGFQGQEHDDEVKGEGNSVNFKYRMHDPRVGRFFVLDPLRAKYPSNSQYAFSENNVVHCVELEGLEKIPFQLAFQVATSLGKTSFGSIVESDIVTKRSLQIMYNAEPGTNFGIMARPRKSAGWGMGIELITGKPSELLEDMVNNPDNYVLDCAQFCQVVALASFKDILGAEKFDKRFNTSPQELSNSVRYDFFIFGHNSAGLKSMGVNLFSVDPKDQIKGMRKANNSRIGSRVCLTADNPEAVLADGGSRDMLNENIVHLGDGQYTAHGLNLPEGQTYSIEDLQQILLDKFGSTYSITEVESYKMGNKRTTEKNEETHRR